MRFAAWTLACVLSGLQLVSCSSATITTRDHEASDTDYRPGDVYVLLNDRYLETPQGWPAPPLVLVIAPRSYSYGEEPRSMDEYRATPGRWTRIAGIAPAGTRIRIDRIEHHRYPGLDDWFEVYGLIESGEFRNRTVNLGQVSTSPPGTRVLRVNPAELALESAAHLEVPR